MGVDYSKSILKASSKTTVDYTFTGGLKVPELMTGIGSRASSHQCVFFISAFKSWDPEAPLRPLTLYARQFDKWMKTWRNFFS